MRLLGVLILGAAWAGSATSAGSAASATPGRALPEWAYPTCPASARRTADPGRVLSVPGSQIHFTEADISRRSVTSDWFPQEHPALPSILAASHAPDKIACGYCHLPDGSGRPENAKLAGLTAPYIIAQVQALKTRARRAAQTDWVPTQLMVQSMADLSDEEIAAAADYFSHRAAKSFVRVVERNQVPNHTLGCFVFLPTRGHAVPLGSRIVEMPADVERFESRDPHTTYVAYVPKGAIERGRRLASTGGGGRTQVCSSCHGLSLKGGTSLPAPPLAGRFPAYLFRQLYGFQSGARAEDGAQSMGAVAARLTRTDMIDLAAYAASLDPE
jgi:cytochrome c553